MALETGQQLLHYRLIEKIGEGGMGVVWKAADTTLDREVAIKMLPAGIAADADRLARFEREARLLASLNHPNIAGVYGLHESDGVHFLAMELIQGEDLAERIARGPLALEEALPVARQIAEALEAAHDNGVIHRDLKPANVVVRADGTAKVLDFGLAKALAPDLPAEDTSISPTVTSAGTMAGMILGTAGYMSPEQAHGREVDRRADLWSLGCMLFELLTGRRAFHGESVSDTLAAVLRTEPRLDDLPPDTPAAIRALIERCLRKDPRKRLQAAGEARIVLEEYLADPAAAANTVATPGVPARANRWPWVVTAAAVLLALVAALGSRTGPQPPPSPVRLDIALTQGDPLMATHGAAAVVSPDGRMVVYTAAGEDGRRRLWIRRLDRLESTPLSGTEGAYHPFFSPDGQAIGFFADDQLKTVDISGVAPVVLCSTSSPGARGGSWGADGTIVFARGIEQGLWRIPASGGTPQTLTTIDDPAKERTHRWPHILPDGRTVLFSAPGPEDHYDDTAIQLVDLQTGERQTIEEQGAYPRYATSGHITFVRNHVLYALPFDAARRKVVGQARPIIRDLAGSLGDQESSNGGAQYSISETGTLIYRREGAQSPMTLAWVDRDGVVTRLNVERGTYTNPEISPDGRRLAIGRADEQQATDLWVVDLERSVMTRLTFDGQGTVYPAWSPDGSRIAYSKRGASGKMNVFVIEADGSGTPKQLFEFEENQWAGSWHPDGEILSVVERTPENSFDIAILRLGDPVIREPLMNTRIGEHFHNFSPDGRWLAYGTNETGSYEVYVTSFPSLAGKWQVSPDGGVQVEWSADGKELFYRKGGTIMSVAFEVSDNAVRLGKPVPVVTAPTVASQFVGSYGPSLDGERWLILQQDDTDDRQMPTHVVLVLNWFETLRQLAPPG